MSVTKNQNGFYYCGLCESIYVKLYKSKEDLLAEHSFEVLLEWVNEKYIPFPYSHFAFYRLTLKRVIQMYNIPPEVLLMPMCQ